MLAYLTLEFPAKSQDENWYRKFAAKIDVEN
jgi:hypothetical protein